MEEKDGTRTIREWRELRGLSREELAEAAGIDADLIARLEEVGSPTYSNTIEGDAFANAVIGPISEALGADIIRLPDVPLDARPGALVLDLVALYELDGSVADFLIEHAEEIGLRLAVPNRWDVGLKSYADVGKADFEAIVAQIEREATHGLAMVERLEDNLALLTEHAEHEGQMMGDVLEERGGRWAPKRQGSPEEAEG